MLAAAGTRRGGATIWWDGSAASRREGLPCRPSARTGSGLLMVLPGGRIGHEDRAGYPPDRRQQHDQRLPWSSRPGGGRSLTPGCPATTRTSPLSWPRWAGRPRTCGRWCWPTGIPITLALRSGCAVSGGFRCRSARPMPPWPGARCRTRRKGYGRSSSGPCSAFVVHAAGRRPAHSQAAAGGDLRRRGDAGGSGEPAGHLDSRPYPRQRRAALGSTGRLVRR